MPSNAITPKTAMADDWIWSISCLNVNFQDLKLTKAQKGMPQWIHRWKLEPVIIDKVHHILSNHIHHSQVSKLSNNRISLLPCLGTVIVISIHVIEWHFYTIFLQHENFFKYFFISTSSSCFCPPRRKSPDFNFYHRPTSETTTALNEVLKTTWWLTVWIHPIL